MISRSVLERRRYSCGRGIRQGIYKARLRDNGCGRHNAALVRILIFHGYLLRGTGSNVYNAALVTALAKLGHEVHLLCQDHHAGELPFVDAVGRWEDRELRVATIREPVRVTAYLPDIGRTLPVYVADTYEGFDARPYPELSDGQIEHYVSVNAAAVREVAERAGVEVGLANHLVMGPAILGRGLDAPYAVKVHGSALTYTVAPHRERFLPYAAEGLDRASAVLVGSRHTAEGLWEVMDDPAVREKTRLGPPGVDAEEFVPRADAAERLAALADRLAGADAAGWGGEAGAAEALRSLDPARDRIVSYVGKLIVSKGVDLLIAAWPLVADVVPEARLVVVGFGTYRQGSEQLANALRDGDLEAARGIARRGRALEGGPEGELRYLRAFLDRLDADPDRRARYVAAAAHGLVRIHFTGRLEHSDLPSLLPACQAQVVPSTWPEAFGMVAAEAASCGVLPVSAAHSGLAEVSRILAGALPEDLRPLLSFELGDDAVEQMADRLIRWLELDPETRAAASEELSGLARERFSWEGVARGVIDAAEGRLDALPLP
jgi:glycosyltransferase involved in cell wall biosynthesis